MKKYLILVLSILALTGCGSNKQQWAKDIKGTKFANCPLTQNEYYVEYTETNADMELHGDLTYTVAISEDKIATNDFSGGYENYIIVDEKGTHIVNHEFKVVMERPGNIENTNKDIFNLQLMGDLIREGEEDNLYYEEYNYDTNYIRFYFDENDTLVKIVKSYEQTVSTIDIHEITNKLPEDCFNIPTDYKIN